MLCLSSTLGWAQEPWQRQASISATAGHYVDSQTMNNQQSLGLRLSGEKNKKWGLTAGLQSTSVHMNPLMPMTTQAQDSLLLSGFARYPSNKLPGYWTFHIDTHQATNNASQSNSSHVRALAPQVSWASASKPMKGDFSFARSDYKYSSPVQQISAAIAYGFSGGQNWLELRSYHISKLDPALSMGQSTTQALDTRLTHVIKSKTPWMPTSVSLGLEHGNKIYKVDMGSQTVYNLPMLNEGGESLAGSWQLNHKSALNVQLNSTRYYADTSVAPSAHRFSLNTLSFQFSSGW